MNTTKLKTMVLVVVLGLSTYISSANNHKLKIEENGNITKDI